jgi:hypothetical protein
MLITLYRDNGGLESTIGRLCIGEGITERHFCYTLEDQRQVKKVKGETRIPAGTYEIKLRTVGGFTKRYEQRFPGMHRGMLWLQNVPGFEYILIHIGNDDDDTAGCLLVGYSCNLDSRNGGGTIGRSTEAYKDLYKLVIEAMDKGEEVFIAIKDEGIK